MDVRRFAALALRGARLRVGRRTSRPECRAGCTSLDGRRAERQDGRVRSDRTRPRFLGARTILTSFLNPKGLFVYLSIVPQFVDPSGNAGLQALALSVTNAALCYVVYAGVGLLAARSGRARTVSSLRARVAEGIGGTLLGGMALRLAVD